MSSGAVAGVDVGGGGIRFRVELDERRADHRLSAAMPNRRGKIDVDALVSVIAEGVNQAASQIDAEALSGLAVGVSGLPGRLDHPEDLARRLSTVIEVRSTVIAGDSVTAHAGALGLDPGSVVSAGTGVIALGTDFVDIWNRADGWGFLLGDEGGGAWIGAAGLRAALRAHDGRTGGSMILLDRMTREFGQPDSVVHRVYDEHMPAHVLASFAPAVADAARVGDPVANSIWAEAAVHLANAVTSVGAGVDGVVSWSGGLFGAGHVLLQPFAAEVRRILPDVRLVAPSGSSLDGAIRIAHAISNQDSHLGTRNPYLYLVRT